MHQEIKHPFGWFALELLSAGLGGLVAAMFLTGPPTMRALALYVAATSASIAAGWRLTFAAKDRANPSNEDRRAVARLNDNVHRRAVVTINGSVTAALVYRLVVDTHLPGRTGMLSVLGIFAAVYFGSYAFKVVRAHSVIARFRSAVLRATLIMVMADLIWGPTGMVVAAGVSLLALMVTLSHLMEERDRWGWDIR